MQSNWNHFTNSPTSATLGKLLQTKLPLCHDADSYYMLNIEALQPTSTQLEFEFEKSDISISTFINVANQDFNKQTLNELDSLW